jgi:hypothetical protein
VFDQNTLDPTAILEALGLSRPTRSTPIHGGSDTLIWTDACAVAQAFLICRVGKH